MSISNRESKEDNFKYAKRLHTSQAFKKPEVYFQAIIRSKKFKKFVKETREKHKIPPQGFNNDTEAWSRWLIKYSAKDNITAHWAVMRDIEKICEEFGLNYAEWQEVIDPIVYDDYFQVLPLYRNRFALCHVVELKDLYEHPVEQLYARFQPVAILLSPEAGVNDIVDYVKTVYSQDIAPLQARYQNPKNKMNKPNSKNPRFKYRDPKNVELIDFVYENRGLSAKNWDQILREKRATISDFKEKGSYYIDARKRKDIIKSEEKRRENV